MPAQQRRIHVFSIYFYFFIAFASFEAALYSLSIPSSSSSSLSQPTLAHGPHVLLTDWKIIHYQATSSDNNNNDNNVVQVETQERIPDGVLKHAVNHLVPTFSKSDNTTTGTAKVAAIHDGKKDVIIRVLQKAGVISDGDTTNDSPKLTTEEVAMLPDDATLEHLYGPLENAVVIGRERCQQYRDMVPPNERYTAPGGMFNTGTNALTYHMKHNLPLNNQNSANPHYVWQLPWGKHRTESQRNHNRAAHVESANHNTVLPVIMVRDPFFWMQSMCKSPYSAHWRHSPHHCPNLVPTDEDKKRWHGYNFLPENINITDSIGTSVPVKVVFDRDKDVVHWDSLAQLWDKWYMDYVNADYPRLIVRFEDMLFHAPTVMGEIYTCLTGEPYPIDSHQFQYQVSAAKKHGSGTDMVRAMMKTGDLEKRLHGLTSQDLEYARAHLDPELLELFRYSLP